MSENNKDIELRSEKIRNVVGKIPPRMLKIGISIISIVIICVLILAYVIPYPQYKTIPIYFHSNPIVQTEISDTEGMFHQEAKSSTVSKGDKIGWIENGEASITELYSANSGKIIFNVNDGDFVSKNNVLFSIIPDSIQSIYAFGYIDFKEIDNIQVGQAVSVIGKIGYKEGEIVNIYPISEIDTITGQYLLKFKISFGKDILKQDISFLFPNNTYTAKIQVSTQPILQKALTS